MQYKLIINNIKIVIVMIKLSNKLT